MSSSRVPKSFSFRRRHRLRLAREFRAVYEARCRKAQGPLVLFARPNDMEHPRLGLSVRRTVGTAVRRNRIKRLIREAFRFMQHDWPRGYDLIVVVRPHDPLTLAEYQRCIHKAMRQLHREWDRRLSRGVRASEKSEP